MLNSCSIGNKTVDLVLIACLICTTMVSDPRRATAGDSDSKSLIYCDIHQGPCTKELAGMRVTLDILPKPVTAMKDLKFLVALSGEKKNTIPYIDLAMPGMNMGLNRVELRPVKDNVFEGQGIIVRCPSGRRTWKATVTLPEVGKVEFLFDVVY